MPKIDDNKNQFTVRIDSKRQQINEFIERYEAETGEKLELQKDVFFALLKTATADKQANNAEFETLKTGNNHLKEVIEEYEVYFKEQKQQIENQTKTIETLQNLCDKQSGFETELLKVQADFEKNMSVENILQKEISELKSKFNISDFQYSLAVANIRKNKEAVEVLRKMYDKHGTGIYEILSPYSEENADISEENVFNLILNTFMHSALYQRALSSVLTKSQLETSIANFKSNKK